MPSDADPNSTAKHIDWSTGGAGFGRYDPSDELLHPNVANPDPTVSETWLYMWYAPEARISAW
ncbi:MAG: hypothetical protein ABWZ40_11100, partial [Caulobacterales bacterium]